LCTRQTSAGQRPTRAAWCGRRERGRERCRRVAGESGRGAATTCDFPEMAMRQATQDLGSPLAGLDFCTLGGEARPWCGAAFPSEPPTQGRRADDEYAREKMARQSGRLPPGYRRGRRRAGCRGRAHLLPTPRQRSSGIRWRGSRGSLRAAGAREEGRAAKAMRTCCYPGRVGGPRELVCEAAGVPLFGPPKIAVIGSAIKLIQGHLFIHFSIVIVV
jgi:hypothetical protein